MFDPTPPAQSSRREAAGKRSRAVLVGIQLGALSSAEFEASLVELRRLAETLGLEVIGQVTQRRDTLSVSAGIGEGKLQELATFTGGSGQVPGYVPLGTQVEEPEDLPDTLTPEERAEVVLVDHELSPRQMRNLELATGAEVLDRSMVVVSIFQRHARSREAKLQVELARLAYLAPRLRESGAGGDRQRGGIGGKGAGETSLELNRRQIRDRMAELRREIELVQRTTDTQRTRRSENQTVAIVGYTNAGKSSLMRILTGDGVYVADQLFATLETTVRVLKPETRPRILVSDTVGFIKNLPHDLVASFRSTLQEAADASLLVHLVDGSDPAFRDQLRVTEEVLADIEVNDAQRLLVLNKADCLNHDQRMALQEEFPEAVLMSAHREQDVAALHARIVAFFEESMVEREFVVPYQRQAFVAMLHSQCRVVTEVHDELGTRIVVRAPEAILSKLQHAFGDVDAATADPGDA